MRVFVLRNFYQPCEILRFKLSFIGDVSREVKRMVGAWKVYLMFCSISRSDGKGKKEEREKETLVIPLELPKSGGVEYKGRHGVLAPTFRHN